MPDIQDQPVSPAENQEKEVSPKTIGASRLADASSLNKPEEKKPLPKIKYPPLLWLKTQELVKEIKKEIQVEVLVYFTQESAKICNEDVDYFFSHVRELPPESPLALVLISSGGEVTAAWRIANVLRNYCQELTVIVPSRCASTATLLALSAEKILFGPAGYLTAIDSSLTHSLNPRPIPSQPPTNVSVDQVSRIVKFIEKHLKKNPGSKTLPEILFEKIHPVVLAELERTSSLSKMTAKNLMKLRRNAPSEADQNRIADLLNDAYPSHGYPIVLREAQQIGLPAEPTPKVLNPLLWELVKLYSIISKKETTNFIPSWYHSEGMPVIIESTNKRTFYNYSYDKRLMHHPVGWVTESDHSRWRSLTPDRQSPGKPIMSEIEL